VASEDPVARGIAGLSLVVALGSLLWNIYVGRRDNPGVQLEVKFGYVYQRALDGRQRRHGPYVNYQVMNAGRRPVTITEVGFLGPGSKLQVLPAEPSALPQLQHATNLPAELTEGARTSYVLPADPLSEEQRTAVGEVPLAYVRDGVDRTYTARIPPDLLERLWPGRSYAPWWQVWRHRRWQWWRWKA
jgi:hypothetical protein